MIMRNHRAKSSYGHSTTQPVRQLATGNLPEQSQQIKLNDIRHKRKQLESKLKMVSNRINYKKKKQEEELRKMLRSQEQVRSMSETRTFKKFNQIIKEEVTQKHIFQSRKKAKEVQDFRMTNLKRMNLISQALKDRKVSQSEKLRRLKKADEQIIELSKQQALQNKKQKRQSILRLRERQQIRKKCFWLQKKISYQQRLANEAQIYEKQIQQYYRKIQRMRVHEDELRQQQQKAAEALKSAQQNYSLLRQS